MSRAVGQLEKMYNILNLDKFNGELPTPIITVQSKPGTWGHCTVQRVWENKEQEQYEMNIAAEVVNGPIEEIIDTLLHEMVHLYCWEHKIQETSRGGKYHNGKFKELAEKVGCICVKAGQYGWNTQGTGNDTFIEYALEKGWSEIKISRRGVWLGLGTVSGGSSGSSAGGTAGAAPGGKKPSSTRKLQCPKCRNSVRATKAVNIICGDCMETMVEV